MYENTHPERITHYTKLKDNIINWDVNFPCSNNDIDKFEEINKGLISINVFHEFDYDGKPSIALHRKTKTINATHHISLLKIEDGNGKNHYVYIKDYDKLIGSQTNQHTNKLFHCMYCQHGF